jgi:hypothetical protein
MENYFLRIFIDFPNNQKLMGNPNHFPSLDFQSLSKIVLFGKEAAKKRKLCDGFRSFFILKFSAQLEFIFDTVLVNFEKC